MCLRCCNYHKGLEYKMLFARYSPLKEKSTIVFEQINNDAFKPSETVFSSYTINRDAFIIHSVASNSLLLT